jgi:hypothetical protein
MERGVAPRLEEHGGAKQPPHAARELHSQQSRLARSCPPAKLDTNLAAISPPLGAASLSVPSHVHASRLAPTVHCGRPRAESPSSHTLRLASLSAGLVLAAAAAASALSTWRKDSQRASSARRAASAPAPSHSTLALSASLSPAAQRSHPHPSDAQNEQLACLCHWRCAPRAPRRAALGAARAEWRVASRQRRATRGSPRAPAGSRAKRQPPQAQCPRARAHAKPTARPAARRGRVARCAERCTTAWTQARACV